MRYSSHPPRAFRNRIAKSIGVLVAAALVAVLGLPTAAQAQKGIKATQIAGARCLHADEGLMVAWSNRGASVMEFDNWIVTFTEPGTENDWLNHRCQRRWQSYSCHCY